MQRKSRSAVWNWLLKGAVYFGLVFAIGFILALIRIPFLVPLFGELVAVAIELPVILTMSWVICRRVVEFRNDCPTIAARMVIGGTALLLLLFAEFGLAIIVFDRTLGDHLNSYTNTPQALGLAGQVLFGFFPVLQFGYIRSAPR